MDKFKMNMKNFYTQCKYMYKDKVDLFFHLLIVCLFVGSLISGDDFAMGVAGFIGVYAFGAAYRSSFWKKKVEGLLN